MSDVTRHDLPSGETVFYRDRDHSYWTGYDEGTGKCSGRMAGVSTVAKVFDLDVFGAASGWGAKMTREGIAILASDAQGLDGDDLRAALAWLNSADGIAEALADARLRHTDKRDEAAGRGTAVHETVLHALASGAVVPDMDSLSEDEKGYAQAVIKWWLNVDPAPELSEVLVADVGSGIAGRFDLVANIKGKRTLIDLKSGAAVRVSASAQLAGYQALMERSGYGPVDTSMVLLARADGSYVVSPGRAGPEDFWRAVKVYRKAGEIRRGITADNKQAVAA